MEKNNDKNKRKTKLLMATLIAIIVLLFAGIIYQFVVIKSLQKQIPNNSTAIVCIENTKKHQKTI